MFPTRLCVSTVELGEEMVRAYAWHQDKEICSTLARVSLNIIAVVVPTMATMPNVGSTECGAVGYAALFKMLTFICGGAYLFNLYISNHGNKEKNSVGDIVNILSHALKRQGVKLNISEELHNSEINIFIEGIVNYKCLKLVIDFAESRTPACLVYVLTEFIERRFMVTSLNNFGGIVDAAILSLINICLRHKYKYFRKTNLQSYLSFLLLSPILLIWMITVGSHKFLTNILRFIRYDRRILTLFRMPGRVNYLINWHWRYLGLERTIAYADCVVCLHEGNRKSYEKLRDEIGAPVVPATVIYPEFTYDELPSDLKDRECYIEMTGSITNYRASFTKLIDTEIAALGLHHVFGKSQCYSFSESAKISPGKRAAFSLHPPQTSMWPYSSPLRIYRALIVDKNIPILTRYFKQHPIEELCLVFKSRETILNLRELYTNKDVLLELLNKKAIQYIELASEANNYFYDICLSCHGIKNKEATKSE